MKNPKTKKKPKPETSAEYFRRFLAAADVVALDLLLNDGILESNGRDRNEYFVALEELAAEFRGPFKTTELDDLMHHEEAGAIRDAAYMVGLALGLRLRGADLAGGGAR